MRVANRLQAAHWREAIHLVAEGVISVADVDAAVCWGPGLRREAFAAADRLFDLGEEAGRLQRHVPASVSPAFVGGFQKSNQLDRVFGRNGRRSAA